MMDVKLVESANLDYRGLVDSGQGPLIDPDGDMIVPRLPSKASVVNGVEGTN